MQPKTWRRKALLPIALSLGLLAAACGDDEEDTSTDEGTEETGDEGGEAAAGSINVSGSSTVEPITALVAEEFLLENEDADIAVDGPGTGDGFELFCEGQTDISDASRQIKDEEAQVCTDNGIEYVEIEVAIDGMAVMTNPNNDAVECLSFADLYALVGPESEGFGNWSDAQDLASSLGSDTELPDASLDLTGPGTESGTYDSFVELALEGIAEEQGQEGTTRSDYDANADDNVIISNIESSDTSLGWVGFAYAAEAGDSVKLLGVSEEPGGDCVVPDAETIADGSYPLSRSLYIYVNTANAEENQTLADFVDFYVSDLPGFAEAADYIALPDDRVQASVDAWEGR